MNKTLFAAALIVVSLGVQAETITLSQSQCSGTRVCDNIPNSAAADIDISASTLGGPLGVTIDGQFFDGGSYALVQVTGVPCAAASACTTYTLGDTALAQSGDSLSINGRLQHWTKAVNNGRAHYYIQYWLWLDGAITR